MQVPNITAPTAGARYRVVPYSDVSRRHAPVVSYGLDEKLPGSRVYRVVGWHGQHAPWTSMAEARSAVALLNELAQARVKESAITAKDFAGTIEAMVADLPGGPDGFLKSWGVEHIVRATLKRFAPHLQLPPADACRTTQDELTAFHARMTRERDAATGKEAT